MSTLYVRYSNGGVAEITSHVGDDQPVPEGATEIEQGEFQAALAASEDERMTTLQAALAAEQATKEANYQTLIDGGMSPEMAAVIARWAPPS